ncbi:MAG: helix-turn-helix domain-containing protein [Ilumatobacteraceae bacterium]
MSLQFRNVDVDPDSDQDTWPFEAVLTAFERGSLVDWRRLAATVRAQPWGPCARAVETIAGWNEYSGLDTLFRSIIANARRRADESSCIRYGRRIREVRQALGLSQREFAPLIGTSAQRLSSYERGRVAPSVAILGRVDRLATAR